MKHVPARPVHFLRDKLHQELFLACRRVNPANKFSSREAPSNSTGGELDLHSISTREGESNPRKGWPASKVQNVFASQSGSGFLGSWGGAYTMNMGKSTEDRE